jgi:hypothetical protein
LQYGQYDFEKTATAFSSMMLWTLVLVADMVAGERLRAEEPKKRRRREEMVGGCVKVRGEELRSWVLERCV